MVATLRVMSSASDSVQVPTVRIGMVPTAALELAATLAAERMLAPILRPRNDASRLAAEFGAV
jgi:hypothetical protein